MISAGGACAGSILLVSLCRGVGLQEADTSRDSAARAPGENMGREILSTGNVGVCPLIPACMTLRSIDRASSLRIA